MTKVHLLESRQRFKLGISSGIPIPGPQRQSMLRDQLKACNVGDSFLTKRTNKSTVYYFAKQLGIKANCRPINEEYFRVWRTK